LVRAIILLAPHMPQRFQALDSKIEASVFEFDLTSRVLLG